MSFSGILFYILAFVLIVAAARIVTARSPVTAVLHLILSFFTASMLWLLLGAEYLGLLLIVVYVGAVMVLFLFVVMMIDVVPESLRHNFRAYLPLGILVGGIMVIEIAFVFGSSYLDSGASIHTADTYNNTFELGKVMYSEYIYAIQVGAVLLLVGMVSAIAITLRSAHNTKHVKPGQQLKVKAADRVRIINLASESEKPAEVVADEESQS